MAEEIKTQNEQKNTVATVGMWFSIIGLIALITVFFAGIGLPLLFIGFILGIIGLFRKPRGKARVAVCIPLIVLIVIVSIGCYLWKSIKTPATEFVSRTETQMEQFDEETFDNDRFELILQSEVNDLVNSKSEDEWKDMYQNSTGSNAIERASYLFFSVLQQAVESSIEKYNNNELPEVYDESSNIIDVDVDINDEDEDEDNENNDENNEDNNENEDNEEVNVEQPKSNNGTFSQNEKNDIEQVLNILE